MRDSVIIERALTGDAELSATAISDIPLEAATGGEVPNVGTVLDERYEITGLLGQGGMGLVLAARHVVLGQRLAIKVLRREMTRDAEIVERFRREAKAASAIGHTGIVAVKDFGSLPSGASYYVMEHVDGVSLADALAQERQFTVARAIDVVSQMADALGAAHAAGVVHRDVKPENVLLASFHGRPDHVKLLDFGIAKLDFASRLSGAHRVLGTPAYMSPEQARGQKLDHRCDVYALGIVFYELLAGDVPFDDKRPLEVLRQQIHTPAPAVRLIRPDVPDEVAALIASCLEKSPEARPSSMQVVVERLAPYALVPAPATSSVPTPAPRATPRVPLPSISVTPIAAPSRATPVTAAAPARYTRTALALGIVLCLVGFVALAAAGGIAMRHRRDLAASVSAPMPIAAPIAPVIAAAPAPPPVPPPTSVAATPPPITVAPTHPLHLGHPATHVVPAVTGPVEAAPAPAAEPTHPTIRVIDPWDDPTDEPTE